jgi:glycosyltransferase involved in cell wall biosynthesis
MKVSVITINYNNAKGLNNTIDSVIWQSYRDYEYIIIDGGSTDGSVDIIQKYADKFSYWVSEKDQGIYNAMNKGVAQASGDYCLFLNSGDVFFDEFVLERVFKSQYTEDIIVGKMYSNSDGSIIYPPPSRELSMYFLYTASITHQSSFIRRDLLVKYPYDEKYKISSDWKFYLQTVILNDCSVLFIDENVSIFDTCGVSSNNTHISWSERETILNELFPRRIIMDYKWMKQSECKTISLAPLFRKYYYIDRMVYFIGNFLLKIRVWVKH